MGKETPNQRNSTNRSSRPYDYSNSFVEKVKSRLSGYFGFLSTPEQSTSISVPEQPPQTTSTVRQDAPLPKRLKLSSVLSPIPIDPGPSSSNHFNFRQLERHEPLESDPGPSGLQHQHAYSTPSVEAKNCGPRDDRSESSESTSGCSSLVPQADRLSQSAFASTSRRKSMALDDKLSYARQLRQSRSSLYLNRSIPVKSDTPRPSRTPSFDVSAYGNQIFNSSNVREKMLNSPFYTGHTSFGGASASRRGSLSGLDSRRQQISVKPAHTDGDDLNMSSTAKRILAALEEFSTPLADAKRIPAPTQPLAAKRRAFDTTRSNPAKRPALAVPTVADLLKMRRLEQIQESTAAARQIVGQTSTPVIKTPPKQPYPPVESGKKFERIPQLKSNDIACPLPSYDLPKVSLPISSLPKFDLKLPEMAASPSLASTTKSSSIFSFSLPSQVDENAVRDSPYLPTEFKFCEPVSFDDWLRDQGGFPLTMKMSPDAFAKLKRKPAQDSSKLAASSAKLDNYFDKKEEPSAKKINDSSGSAKALPVSKPQTQNDSIDTRTVNSIYNSKIPGFGDKFKPAPGSWTCDSCMIQNTSAVNKCAACEASKPGVDSSQPALSSSFASKFKPPAGSWSCESCMVNNVAKDDKCIACGSPKNGSIQVSKSASPISGFGDKFKPAKGSWCCSVCMVSNTEDKVKCVSCEAEKPVQKPSAAISSGFGEKFKPAAGTWSCDTCMVSNKLLAVKCVACESPKPGATTSNGPFSGFGDLVKKKAGTWECSVCLINNDDSKGKCAACETARPEGPATSIKSTTSFSFGLPPGGCAFNFGIDKAGDSGNVQNGPSSVPPSKPAVLNEVKTSLGTFTFGIPPTEMKSDLPGTTVGLGSSKPPQEDTKAPTQFFGIEVKKVDVKESNTVETKVPTFSFGIPSSLSQPSSTVAQPFTFTSTPSFNSFSAPAVNKPAVASAALPSFGFNGSVDNKPLESGISNKTDTSTAAFGNASFSIATPPSFGSTNSTPSAHPTATFGSTPFASTFTTAPKTGGTLETKPFTFGAGSTNNITNNTSAPIGVFTFGAQRATAEPKIPGSGFSFGPPSAPVSFSGLGSTPAFGVPSSGEAFGQNSTPAAFGASAPFAFGASSGNNQFPTNAPAPAPLQFPSAAPPSTPFQFPTASAAAPSGFSLTIPSSFNFSGGQTPSFSADPFSAPTAQPTRRIIKKAVRRTQR